MEDPKERVSRLLAQAELSTDEKRWLLQYLEDTDGEEMRSIMKEQFNIELNKVERVDPEITEKMLKEIWKETGTTERNQHTIFRMWLIKSTAAAAVIGIFIVSAYLWFNKPAKKEMAATGIKKRSLPKNDFLPGSDKAVLTLADGSTILLDDAQNGSLTVQGNTKVIKLNGKLTYKKSAGNNTEMLYNTIATPRGGQYQVELPDGSIVWLNAASSLHFPTSFTGKERRVEIRGEAYFEIAKNTAMPFVVKVNTAEVQVVGTHFNVMAYDDEAALKTTLLEGTINFVNGDYKGKLRPGQQSQLVKNGQVKITNNINIDEVVAWKNGMFFFKNEDIVSITKQISRWYDVDITYDRSIDELFYARIPRNTRLTDVLRALELTGKVHFKIDGKRIVASP